MGVGGVVPIAVGGVGPRAFTASCSFALLSFVRASEGARASDGLMVALGECHGVVVWYQNVDMAADEDLDGEEMGLSRTEGPDRPPLECPSAAEVHSSIKESRPR